MPETAEFEGDFDSDMIDFGQKVDLCQSIRGVLTNYPEGALLKECVNQDSNPRPSPFG